MNVKYFRFDFSNNTIVGSKTALKKAGNPASEEYKELMKMREVQPKFKIAVKEIKVNDGKRSYKGLGHDIKLKLFHGKHFLSVLNHN